MSTIAVGESTAGIAGSYCSSTFCCQIGALETNHSGAHIDSSLMDRRHERRPFVGRLIGLGEHAMNLFVVVVAVK